MKRILPRAGTALFAGLALCSLPRTTAAQVVSEGRLDTSSPGLSVLDDGDRFGEALAPLGDLDGDGVEDLAVGTPRDDGGGMDRGAVWILFLQADGTVKNARKINSTLGGFAGPLANLDRFGSSVACVGDLDGDDVPDLAVGAPKDDTGGTNAGAVWILFLQTDGSVKDARKIANGTGGLLTSLAPFDNMGNALAAVGDLDGDQRTELAVGIRQRDGVSTDEGAVLVLFLNADGSVATEVEIGGGMGGFFGSLSAFDRFGSGLAGIGDLDGDGTPDLAVGANGDDDGGPNRGAFHVLFLDPAGTASGSAKISATSGGLSQPLGDGDAFGSSLAYLGDLEGDGNKEIAVGAPSADGQGADRGEVHIVSLDALGSVRLSRLVGEGSGGFGGTLSDGDAFGVSVAAVGDLDSDGVVDLAIGANGDDNGGGNEVGAAWVCLVGDLPFVQSFNGTGSNPVCLSSRNVPVLGQTWQLAVSTTAFPGATMTAVFGFENALGGVFLSQGELLLDPTSIYLFTSITTPGSFHSLAVPDDPALIGRVLHAQGGVFAPSGFSLCNGLSFALGR